jgi:hypothetical protein
MMKPKILADSVLQVAFVKTRKVAGPVHKAHELHRGSGDLGHVFDLIHFAFDVGLRVILDPEL